MKSSGTAVRNALALTAVMLWASAFVFTRVAVRHFSPLTVSVLRYVAASLVMLVYVLIRRTKLPRPRDILWFAAAGATGFALYVVFFSIGSETLTASVSSLVINVSPLILAVLARIFFKERLGPLKWAACFAGFAGVAVICLGEGVTLSVRIVWPLLSGLCGAAYNIFTRVLLKRGYAALDVTAYSIFAGTLMLLPFLPAAVPELLAAPVEQILIIVYLGVFPASAAYFFWTVVLSKTEKTGDVVGFLFLTPVITSFMGYWGLGELPPATAFIGGALVMAGVIVVTLYRPGAKGEQNAMMLED